jgi:hypothetical protein
VGEILAAAFELYRRHWAILVQVVAILVVPLTLLQYYVSDVVFPRHLEVRNGTIVVSGELGRAAGSGFVLGILTLLVTMILTGAVAWAVGGALVGREPTVGECYRFGYARLWSILWVGVLSVLAIAAGFILLVIPGFIVLTHLVCTIPVVVVERRRGGAALSRSWDLVRGFGWPVFGAIVVTALLTGIVNAIVTAPAGGGWFGQGIAAAIGSVITTPFTALVIGLLYFDLRVRKEHLDVATLERELQASAP